MTKWHVQKPTHRTTQKHVEHKDATDIQKKHYYFVIFGFVKYIPLQQLANTYQI